MDSLLPLHCNSFRVSTCSSSGKREFKFLQKQYRVHRGKSFDLLSLFRPSLCISLPERNWEFYMNRGSSGNIISCGVSSFKTMREEDKKEKKKTKSRRGREKVRLTVRLDHHVEFGEHVAILGSVTELGSWKKKVKMDWTENGWLCELELKGDETVESKFLIVGKDKNLLWEIGDNRVLMLPRKGSFGIACHWKVSLQT